MVQSRARLPRRRLYGWNPKITLAWRCGDCFENRFESLRRLCFDSTGVRCTIRRPSAACWRAATGFAAIHRNCSAIAAGWRCGTILACPSRWCLAIPPTSVATTGDPEANASNGESPNPSAKDAWATTSTARKTSATSVMGCKAGPPITQFSTSGKSSDFAGTENPCSRLRDSVRRRLDPSDGPRRRLQYRLRILLVTDATGKKD